MSAEKRDHVRDLVGFRIFMRELLREVGPESVRNVLEKVQPLSGNTLENMYQEEYNQLMRPFVRVQDLYWREQENGLRVLVRARADCSIVKIEDGGFLGDLQAPPAVNVAVLPAPIQPPPPFQPPVPAPVLGENRTPQRNRVRRSSRFDSSPSSSVTGGRNSRKRGRSSSKDQVEVLDRIAKNFKRSLNRYKRQIEEASKLVDGGASTSNVDA